MRQRIVATVAPMVVTPAVWATIWRSLDMERETSTGRKKRRVRESPGIQDKDGQHCKTLLNHPGIATIEHLLQITWAGALDGQRFLLFQNAIIRGPLYGA